MIRQIGYAKDMSVEEINRVIREINRALLNIPQASTVGGTAPTVIAIQQNNMRTPGFQESLPIQQSVTQADKLTTARNINGVPFDGTANITIYDNTKVPNGGVSTGANTATFSAANKPGSTSGTVQTWLKVTIGVTDYYIPLWI